MSGDLSESVTFTVTVICAQEIYEGRCEGDTLERIFELKSVNANCSLMKN